MTTDTLYDTLARIGATSSKKEKLALVQTLGDYTGWLRRALDPTITYNIGTLDMSFPVGGTETLGREHEVLLDRLASGELSGNAAMDAIHQAMANLTTRSQEVLRCVILKDLRAGIGDGTVNKAFPGLIPVFPYMRCCLPKASNMDKWVWADGIYVQLKADGSFANVDIDTTGSIRVSTRQGREYPRHVMVPLLAELQGRLAWGTRTMGELTVYQDGVLMARKDGNGVLNSLALGGTLADNQEIHFDAWDQIPLSHAVENGRYNEAYKYRFAGVCAQLNSTPGRYTHVIPTTVVYSKAEAMAVYRGYISQGLEGAVVKHPDGPWFDGDNPDQVKLKLEVVVDLRIKGFRPGTPGKRTAATFGSLLCETSDGLLEVGVSGFKRDMEAYLHENRDKVLGDIVAVKANGLMEPTGEEKVFSLFSPRFGLLRKDKREADTLEQVKAQFEAAVS
jgi:DNA ligase-1